MGFKFSEVGNMPKTNSTEDINISVKAMNTLLKALDAFHKAPLKSGLLTTNDEDKDTIKIINDTLEASFELKTKIEDLKNSFQGVRYKSKRFASHRVISNFLNGLN